MQQLSSASLGPRLASDAKRGGIAPLWVIADEEPLLALESADAIRAAARGLGYEEREVLTLSANSDWNQISVAVAAISLFAAKKIVEVRLASPSPGTRGSAALAALGSTPIDPGAVIVIVTVPEADWRVRKSKWFKELTSGAVLVSCDPVPIASFPSWLRARLKSEGLSADDETMRFLAEQTEGNLLAASQEVRKLSLLHEGSTPLTLEEVQSSVLDNSRFDFASVGIAAMKGDAARACRAIEGIRAEFDQSAALPLLMYLFSENIRKMIAVRHHMDATGQTAQSAARELRIWPRDIADAVASGAARLISRKLENALTVCADIDRIYKGIPVPSRDTDPWVELKSVAAFIAR